MILADKIIEERKKLGLSQEELAEKLSVSRQAVSKWETGKGYPDITLLEPLAVTLGVSVAELLSGELIENTNRSFNMLRSRFYVCPVCGNVITAAGNASITCCGINIPPLEAEAPGQNCPFPLNIEQVEDEYYVSIDHPMTKDHYISFMAALTGDHVELVKLYPEGAAAARFRMRGVREIFYYCNKHGLFVRKIK